MQPNLSREYAPEIDGLRAIAVLIVILFHAGISGFSGGFVGVDVFFVISGYLITRNIVNDIKNDSFTFQSFYIRRARRIFPAMFFTMSLVGLLGTWLFSPPHLERLGESLTYASIALSNVFFWHEAGYWDTLDGYKPLLHFWSLAIEEQFYLFWPSFLVVLYYYLPFKERLDQSISLLIGLLTLGSLIAAGHYLAQDSSAVFYLPWYRAFEFGFGALLVWMPSTEKLTNGIKELSFIIGIGAIAIATVFYTPATPFPGPAAIFPCAGAAAIIYSRTAKYSGWILRNKAAVNIGLISYSLYLIHWPVFVFYRYWKLDDLTHIEITGLLAVTLILATLMFLFIERPFRYAPKLRKRHLKPALFFTAMLVCLSMLTFGSAHAWKSGGWPQRVSPDIQAISKLAGYAEKEREKFIYCIRNGEHRCNRNKAKKRYLVLGDSYGEDIAISLYFAYPDVQFVISTIGGCVPIMNYQHTNSDLKKRKECGIYQNLLFDGSRNYANYDGVILAMRWKPERIDHLEETVRYLQSHQARRVFIFGSKTTLKNDTPHLLSHSQSLKDYEDLVLRQSKMSDTQKMDTRIQEISEETGARFMRISGIQCPNNRCMAFVPDTKEPLIWDGGHWSYNGSRHIGSGIKELYPDAF